MKYDDTKTIHKIINNISFNLYANSIKPLITYRLKDPYSILKKMMRKEHSVDKLTDVIAIRIIVPTENDCYGSLAVISQIYDFVPEKIKDFIIFPKNNGYQSIHTIILNVFLGRSIEVQIRTNQMHRIAEFGKANHNEYKKKQGREIKTLLNKISNNVALHKAYTIMQKFNWTLIDLLEYEKEIKNLWNHLSSLKKKS